MRQPFQTEINIFLRQCFQLPVKDLENILVGPMTDVPRQRKSVSEWTPEEWDQRWFSGNLKGHSFLIFYQNQILENIYFSFRMNLRRMRPMMTFGKPHRMLPYNLWKGKFWISLCFNMAFRSSSSLFPRSIFLISRCKHWKYSGLDPNSVSIQIHTNFMQIWGCFANHQFGWTWRGRIMGSTLKLKMADWRTTKAKLIY